MKSIIIIGDGMSDLPVESLGGKTPLMASHKPAIDRIARLGRMGRLQSIPEGMDSGSDVATLSVLGYDPKQCLNGRAVLEAASMGVDLAADDVALRLNLICTENGCIKNHSAGHISTEEAAQIMKTLEAELGSRKGPQSVSLHEGVSYRHLLVLHGDWASPELICAPPHEHVGERTADLMPRATAPAAEAARAKYQELYDRALPILAQHPVNRARIAAGKDPANAIWAWSPGRRPQMKTLQERFGVRGAVISAVDLVMGLGKYAGMDLIRVKGATGLHDTNYEGKAQACLDALAQYDLVFVHVEATDEASHAKDLDLKIRCIEYLDDRLVRHILAGLETRGIEAAVAVLPDHPTHVGSGKHGHEAVPVAILRPGESADTTECYDEKQAEHGALGLMHGDAFIRTLLQA